MQSNFMCCVLKNESISHSRPRPVFWVVLHTPTHREGHTHGVTMNIFRFAGDMCHLLSFIFLLIRLRRSRSAAGAL